MDPYRAPPRLKSTRSSSTPSSALVLLVLGGFVVLGTGAPVGKDFLLWGFTASLVVVIALLWQHGEPNRERTD
jgi:hypothetical protein